MRRRSVLASTAALLTSGFAGCLEQSESISDPTITPPTETSSTPGTTGDRPTTYAFDVSMSVEVDRLQPSVVTLGIDSISAVGAEKQYLFLHVDVTDGDPPQRSAFGFRFGGERYSPGWNGDGQLWRAGETDDRYDAGTGSGWLVFALPESGNADDAALVLGRREWPVDEATRERLAEPAPPLTLEWNVPETPTPGQTPIGFTVTNEGDYDTRFVAGLNETNVRTAYSPIQAFSRLIPAGETVSWEVTHDNGTPPGDPNVDDGEPDGTYVLSWTNGRLEQEVRFVSESESSSE